MVYVKFKEKFHGVNVKGIYLKKHKSVSEAKRNIARWNSLNPSRDRIIVLGMYKEKPIGFIKTRFPNMWKKR